MIRSMPFIILTAVFFLSAPLYAQQGKIGVINMQRALNGTEEGQKELKKLKKRLNSENKIFKKKEDKIKKLQDELSKQGFLLSDKSRVEKEEKFRQLNRDIERYQEDSRAEFTRLQREATDRMFKKLMKILTDYAKNNNFSIILEAGNSNANMPGMVLYNDKKVDVTDDVINLYNKKIGAKK
ncbi:MAG: membrane protein [bacterium]|nr:MAG: membrane protein [bacterium]